MPELTPCDPEIFANGTTIAVIVEMKPQQIENLVSKLSKQTGVRIDWHYFGGKGDILALGDEQQLRKARDAFRPYRSNFVCVVEADGRWT